MKLLHETSRINTNDKYFVCGGNPAGDGGGVIATCPDLQEAHFLQEQAIKQGYSRVRVLTYKELMTDDSQYCSSCGADTANPCGCVSNE